jgi:hypothetical protein
MSCTRHADLIVVDKIVSSECDVYPTVSERKVNYTNGYAVIDPVSFTMLMIVFTSILINLVIRSFQCEFLSSKKYTIGLTNLATPLGM